MSTGSFTTTPRKSWACRTEPRAAAARPGGTRPRPGSWRELLEGDHALATGVVALSILAPALNAFITSTIFPPAVAESGGLSL
jgi:hypothetical protein